MLKAKIFLIDTLSPEVYAYLESIGITLTNLATALINYENNPRLSISQACQMFELFLSKFCADIGTDPSHSNGLIELVNTLRRDRKILSNQVHICTGIGGIRNITHHGPDKETGDPWKITPQASLTTILQIPCVIKSLYLYHFDKIQEY